jgi:hypothetical protein
MLKFDEPDAEAHWARLRAVAPHAILIEGVTGIRAAHAECARRASTSHFFVVDADSWILDGFAFDLDFEPRDDEMAVWRAKNPVNDLTYGHGGIKLIPRSAFGDLKQLNLDMSTQLTPRYRMIRVLASEHRFNMTPLLAWRSAFRECVKLASGLFDLASPTKRRLTVWCSIANEERHASWCLRGARDGRDYAEKNISNPQKLNLINDYTWLESQFIEHYGTAIGRPLAQTEDTKALRT